MNYFVLFSVLLIAACVVILLVPSTREEGFALQPDQYLPSSKVHAKPTQPIAAGQRNSSSTAGTADGGSNNQHLMNNVLRKQDRLAEAFENRKASAVSATTTKKKGIASTGASTGDIPRAGCNKDKCVEIKTPMDAIDGNCVNPTLPNGEPDYSMKYCAAFQPKDYTIDAQECLTCGYYAYAADCVKYDIPNNPTKCLAYGSYKFQTPTGTSENYMTCDADDTVCQMLAQQAGGGQGQGQGSSGPNCSTCKLNVNKTTQCVLPGCYSADDGNLPFPDDGDYNFAEGCFYYNPDPSNPGDNLPGMQGREPGYYCPPITQGQQYDGGGSSGDPCYTKPDSIPDTATPNQPSYTLDYSKFVKMDKACSNDKPKSRQRFVPGKDAPIDGNDMPPPRNTKHRPASKMGATSSTINYQHQHQHQHGGAINVYHHRVSSSGSNNAYVEPVAGAEVLGFL